MPHRRPLFILSLLVASLCGFTLLTGCGTSKGSAFYQAPVEDHSLAPRKPVIVTAEKPPLPLVLAPVAAKPVTNSPAPLGLENEGKPGYYTVKPGDTLIRIGLDQGQNWRDIARWNQLEQPDQIEVGQVLRVIPPEGRSAAAVATPIAPMPVIAGNRAPAPASTASSPTPPPAAATANEPKGLSADSLNWAWPTSSNTPVLQRFDESKNKGLDLAGRAGDPVLAAADGKVVYAGDSLRSYGNLLIVKHNDTFLSAYAHNQRILVKEGQMVTKGQKIAEMGDSGTDRVKLHFEIRKQQKPVDPLLYLPKR